MVKLIERAFNPDPCVHTRLRALALMRIPMCICETTSGIGFDAHLPSIRFCKLIMWAIIHKTSAACYSRHKLEKRRIYEKRIIEVEHGSFTPIVLSSSGGWGPSATVAFKELASQSPFYEARPVLQ